MKRYLFVILTFCTIMLNGCGCMDGEWGFIDKEGNVVVDFKYDGVRSYSNGVAVVIKENKVGLVDYNGREILKPSFSDISDFQGEYSYFVIRREIDGRISESYGFINNKGKVVTEPRYGYVKFVYKDVAAVKKGSDSKYFLLKIVGEQRLTDEIFDDINYFSEDRAVFKSGEKFGVINMSGNKIVDAIYDEIRDYRNGYAIAKIGKKFGLLDKDGKVVLDFVYNDIVGLKNNYVTFNTRGKYGIMELKSKNIVIEPKFDMLSLLSDSFATFCNGNCIKCDGSSCDIDTRAYEFGREMYIGDEVGYVNLKNEIFVMKDVNMASVFSNQRAVLCQWKYSYNQISCYLIDEGLNKVGSEFYKVIREFYDERAAVCNECNYGYGEYYFIDLLGNKINDKAYFQVKDFSDGLAAVERDQVGLTSWGFINKNGEMVIDDEYNKVKPFREGRAAVCKGLCERLGGGHY
ncbi:MAG: WG repeat-containing protein [Deltaproteobacteria bacterium]|nr:WG repeat-containing protein [Deltaproteobacteria bacterium]